jgi:peptidoglycan hydrolase-like protein with peptidoglycan-binding domain
VAAICVLILSFAQSAAGRKDDNVPQGDMLEVERLLADLGYWILKVDGVADASTRHAVTAFQKVEGRKRTGVLSDADIAALKTAVRPTARYPEAKAHIEIDVTRQVLFLTDEDGVVKLIIPVSTGNEKRYFDEGKWQIAHTPRGDFAISRKLSGVRKASLGNLYNPNYFYGGVAIHGSNSVPAKPASHGCVRIPRFADLAFSKMTPVGMKVYVYD